MIPVRYGTASESVRLEVLRKGECSESLIVNNLDASNAAQEISAPTPRHRGVLHLKRRRRFIR